MTDYSQTKEQEIILQFFDGKPAGRFLDLGAYDGMIDSNTRALSDLGWEGVLVEANGNAFGKLVANHWANEKMSLVNGAIIPAPKAGVSRLIRYYEAGDRLGTTWEKNNLADRIQKYWYVSTVTPADLRRTFGSRYEFVSVDIEGTDLEVIQQLGPLLEHTQLICAEAALPYNGFDTGYLGKIMSSLSKHGFKTEVGRTGNAAQPENILLSR